MLSIHNIDSKEIKMKNDPYAYQKAASGNKTVKKLQITRPNGAVETIEVTSYKEYDPKDIIPDAVVVEGNVCNEPKTHITRETFIEILKVMKYMDNYYGAVNLIRTATGASHSKAIELVESL